MKKIALALDLGGTNLRIAAVGEDGTVYARSRTETPKQSSGDEIVAIIVKLADECRTGSPAGSDVFAFGAAVPAAIDQDAGILTKLPNIPALDGFHLRDILKDRLGIAVILENDANAAALGENWLGASCGLDDSIIITLGTGVGGGLIINNQLFRGKDGTAGEIGHVCVEPEGAPCKCGGRGCLEQYASGTALIRMGREAGLDVRSSFDVFTAAKNGDAVATGVFDKMGYYLGIGISNLLNTLNPEMIVLGGGVAASMDMFIAAVNKEVKTRAFRQPAERVKIVRAKLGDDAGILGAAHSAFTRAEKL